MKKLFVFGSILAALFGGIYYFFVYRPAKAAKAKQPTAQTTGTQGGFAAFFPGWTGFNKVSLQNQTDNVRELFADLKTLSNAFGSNDGGKNPGVSTGGSAAGGVQSAGNGAGVPSAGGTANDVFLLANNPPATSLYESFMDLNGSGGF